jgi:phosphatidate cytidylyltransferase
VEAPRTGSDSDAGKRAAKKKGLLVRLTVAPAVLAAVLGLLVWADRSGSSAPTDIVLTLMAAGAAFEVVAMLRKGGRGPRFLVPVVASAALAGLGLLWPHDAVMRGAARSLVFAAAVLAVFVEHLRAPREGDLERLLGAFLPIVFVGYLFGLLREASGDLGDGARRLALIVVASKASDIGGWMVGKSIGRHKMIPSVSPGKTWEGTIGGLVFSMGAAALVLALTGPLPHLATSAVEAAILGLVLGAASIVAGLAHSALKRRVGVKDSSALLPEMGGVLDMIDSLILAAPAAWLWTLLR